MRGQVNSSSVNVEVDAKPGDDMSSTLDQLRSQYEGITEKNRREMDAWYQVKVRGMRRYIMYMPCKKH